MTSQRSGDQPVEDKFNWLDYKLVNKLEVIKKFVFEQIFLVIYVCIEQCTALVSYIIAVNKYLDWKFTAGLLFLKHGQCHMFNI